MVPFTPDESATRIKVREMVDYDTSASETLIVSLGEIIEQTDGDEEVRTAMRCLLDGAPFAMAGGGAFGLYRYTLA
jgi:hypothetical protein